MTVFVVDTNVLMVANGGDTLRDERGDTLRDEQCQLACVRKLRFLAEQGVVAIDDKDYIVAEYRKKMDLSGDKLNQVGNLFLMHVLNNQYSQCPAGESAEFR